MRKILIIYALLALTLPTTIGNGQGLFANKHQKEVFTNLKTNYNDSVAFLLMLSSDTAVSTDVTNRFIESLQNFKLPHSISNKKNKSLGVNYKALVSKYLVYYKNFANSTDLIINSKFDCVTGSALVYYVLNNSALPITIYETPHHVFLTYTYQKKVYALESTNELPFPVQLTDTNILAFAQKTYNTEQATNFFVKQITYKQLIGLYYYNQAANFFNERQYIKARQNAVIASLLYPSVRTTEIVMAIDHIMLALKSQGSENTL